MLLMFVVVENKLNIEIYFPLEVVKLGFVKAKRFRE